MRALITVHGGGERRVVDTSLEMDAWLDALAAVHPPGWVQITTTASRGVLSIALGRDDLSSLRFVDDADPAGTLASNGTLLHALGSYEFSDQGGYSPVPAEEAVAPRDARAAVWEFVQTGHRPTTVTWRQTRSYGSIGAPLQLWA